ncbi:MAG: CocE/NonD family hydrolase [Planctomycetota bacterium]
MKLSLNSVRYGGYFTAPIEQTDLEEVVKRAVTIFLLLSICRISHAQESFAVPMRDGIKLTTKVWYSESKGLRKPVVLSRAYNASVAGQSRFNAAGYHCVGQATRDGGGADGTRFVHDAQDGYDCIDWISKQPWCDGNVVMYGKSYWGITQLLAAIEQHSALKAIVPQNMGPGCWKSGYRCYGAVALAMTAHGRAGNRTDLAFYKSLPLIDLDVIGKGKEDPLWNAYIGAEHFDSYWAKISMRLDGADGKIDKIKIPVFLHAGWYDYYAGVELEFYEYLRRNVNATPEIRIVVSPTDHLDRLPGGRSFPRGDKDEVGLAIRWFDHVIMGKDNGMDSEPKIKLYVMGINEWRGYNDWPPPGTRFTKFYFSMPSGSRSGMLTTTLPDNERPTTYAYDPNDPVMCKGGSHSWCWGDNPYAPVGSYDQSSQEARSDVLVFKTPPLEKDTEVTGPIKVRLYASSDCRDTDFVGVLLDVHPDGKAYNLTEGIIRARYREDWLAPPKLMIPGTIYEIEIDLRATSNVFLAGHRIGLYVTSSYFAMWDRNLNTGDPISTGIQTKIAHNIIYHDTEHPSHIILPIVPDEQMRTSMSTAMSIVP